MARRKHRRRSAAAPPQPPRAAAAAPQPPPAAASPPGSPTLGWLRESIQAEKDLKKAQKELNDLSAIVWNPLAKAATGLTDEEISLKIVEATRNFANANTVYQRVAGGIAFNLALRVETKEDVDGAKSLRSFGFNGYVKVNPEDSELLEYVSKQGLRVANF